MAPQKTAMSNRSAKAIFSFIRKRDGRIMPFDESRITAAVLKALTHTGEGSMDDAAKISKAVVAALLKRRTPESVPGIEDVQDVVETQLIIMDYAKTAKSYILYRYERTQLRDQAREVPDHVKKLVKESKQYFRNSLSEFIYYRTYSRWIDEESRRETWVETVNRYMMFMKENMGDMVTPREYEDIRQGILKQEAMPSMRLLWSAGKAARANHVTAFNCSFTAPTKLEDFAEIMYLAMSGAGVGFSVESQTVHQLPQIKPQTGKMLPTHMVGDSKEGWCDSLTAGLKAWFGGKDIKFDYSHVRLQGARLKTMGGKSSGPEPLRSLLDGVRSKILAKQNRHLSTLDVHDIICKIGAIVVVGGVRRTALISLSDLHDEDMRHAKDGMFYIKEPDRAMANNSAVYLERPNAVEFMQEWLALAQSGSGERGIFNRGGLAAQMPARRFAMSKKHIGTTGTNPCVPQDTWIMTEKGAQQVHELIHVPFKAMVNGKIYNSEGFFETGIKDIFEIRTNRGFAVRATDNHKISVVDYKARKVQKTVWKEVKDIKAGDRIVLHDHASAEWEGNGTEEEGWLLGNLLGDGNIQKNGRVNLDYWGEQRAEMLHYAVASIHATVGGRSDMVGHIAATGYARVGSTQLGNFAAAYGMAHGHKIVSNAVERGSAALYRGFIRGWFDADGSVQGDQKKGVSIRLASNELLNLEAVQRMLARLGIIATIYRNRRTAHLKSMPDGKGGMKLYACAANHELVMSGENINIFAKRIGFRDQNKKQRLFEVLKNYHRAFNKESFAATVEDIVYIGSEPVYDCAVENVHAFDANGVYVHNCGEILLRSHEFCNLSEVVCRRDDTQESLTRKIRLATLLGTYQCMLTDYPYISKDWKKNCDEERLLGVSLTGQWDCPAVRNPKTLAYLKAEAIRVNEKYAKKFNINASASITCVKPSGNVSQLVDASSGMHPRHAPHYIRRVRIGAVDSLFQMMKDQKVPFHPEVGQAEENASVFVFEFPVMAPKSTTYRNDLTAIQQLDHWRMVKEHYTEHNPSVTVSISDNEWLGVADWLYKNWDMVGGLSFLPRNDHVYALAPYEAVDEARYKELLSHFPTIDFSQIVLYERDDETQGAKELACVSGTCEIT